MTGYKLANNQSGATAVEFALILPVMLLFIFGIIEFGVLMYNKQVLTNACREGARAGVVVRSPRNQVNEDAEIRATVLQYARDHLVTFEANGTLADDDINMPEYAKNVCAELKRKFKVFYDESGAVGRRYARMDEAGHPIDSAVSAAGKAVTLPRIQPHQHFHQELVPPTTDSGTVRLATDSCLARSKQPQNAQRLPAFVCRVKASHSDGQPRHRAGSTPPGVNRLLPTSGHRQYGRPLNRASHHEPVARQP